MKKIIGLLCLAMLLLLVGCDQEQPTEDSTNYTLYYIDK